MISGERSADGQAVCTLSRDRVHLKSWGDGKAEAEDGVGGGAVWGQVVGVGRQLEARTACRLSHASYIKGAH